MADKKYRINFEMTDGSVQSVEFTVWTDADKAEIVQQVLDALKGQSVIGVVDENNNIILSGFAEGTYTLKYKFDDGSVSDIASLTVGGAAEPEEPETPEEPGDATVVIAIPWVEDLHIESDATKPDHETSGYLSTGEFMAIEDGYTYTLHSKTVANLSMYVLWYSDDVYTSFISRTDSLGSTFNTSGGVYTIAPPSGAKYMRFRANTSGNYANWKDNIVLTRYKND